MRILLITNSENKVFEFARYKINKSLQKNHIIVNYVWKKKINLIQRIFRFIKIKNFSQLFFKMSYLRHYKLMNYYNKNKWKNINNYFDDLLINLDSKKKSKHRLKLKYKNNINESLNKIKKGEFDALILVGSPYIKKQNFLKFPLRLNLHIGYLPFYKGMKTIERAIIDNKFDRIGFSINKVDEILDGGSIVFRKNIINTRNKSISQLYILCFKQGIDAIVNYINKCNFKSCNVKNYKYNAFNEYNFTFKYYKTILNKIKL